MASGGSVLIAISSWAARFRSSEAVSSVKAGGSRFSGLLKRVPSRPQRTTARNVFPRILDEYVVREFLGTFLLVLSGFVMLMLVFTFFELMGDILRHRIRLHCGRLSAQPDPEMLYQIAPLAVLIAVLVTFGVLNRNSEIIAMKATGISLYRLVVPSFPSPPSWP